MYNTVKQGVYKLRERGRKLLRSYIVIITFPSKITGNWGLVMRLTLCKGLGGFLLITENLKKILNNFSSTPVRICVKDDSPLHVTSSDA